MNRHNSIALKILTVLITLIVVSSCKEFYNPDQELNLTEDHLYDDWYEYRSVEMGLYSLQQDLAEQLVVLGELRADLLTITPNADADMVEIYNFNVSKSNKYASPTVFFKLIGACNNFIRILKDGPCISYNCFVYYKQVNCIRYHSIPFCSKMSSSIAGY